MHWSRRTILRSSLTAAPLLYTGFLSATAATAETVAAPAPEQWFWTPGHTLTLKSSGKETAGTCAWMLVENEPRQGVPFHKHTHEDESFYVVSGLFEVTVGDKTVTGGPGTYVFGPRGTVHRWTNVGQQRGQLLNVFSPAGLEEYFLAVGIPIKTSSEQPAVDIPALGAKMAQLREKFGLIRTGPLKFPSTGPYGELQKSPGQS